MVSKVTQVEQSKPRININRVNLYLDIALVIAFAVEMEEHFTGLHNHELLGLAFGTALLIHIVLHWSWIVSVTKSFFAHLFHESRLNYVLNLALLIDMGVVVITGIIISRTLGLNLGGSDNGVIQPLHLLASHLSLILIGLHVALHWKWIVTHVQKYLLRLPQLLRRGVTPVPSEAAIQFSSSSTDTNA
ncbi:MAG: DUF4405 domain-containing protein [Anaerolineae bacterium]|nr:DUF4405 domain-containing protein [Anaerolineae bacterium]